ncbi:MAG: hypothetical protein AABW68_04620 [archaeon]
MDGLALEHVPLPPQSDGQDACVSPPSHVPFPQLKYPEDEHEEEEAAQYCPAEVLHQYPPTPEHAEVVGQC